jgi:hypothetical protein
MGKGAPTGAAKTPSSLPTKLPQLPELEGEEFVSKNVYSDIDNMKVISEWFNSMVQESGLTECMFWANVRLLIAFLACMISFHAYLGLSWPQERGKMACCVAMFWLFYGMILYLDKFILRHTVKTVRWGFGRRLLFNLHMPKADEMCEVGVRVEEPEHLISKQVPVAKFFCKDGTLHQANLHGVFADLVNEIGGVVMGTKKTE